MTNYTKTEHLGLDLYGDSDPADLRDGHNNNMRVLDDKVSQNIDDITNTRAAVTTLTTTVADKADKTALDAKADKTTVYTKMETDDKLGLKADKTDTYTKTETETALSLKAAANTVYTKTETDDKLAMKADANAVYTKPETDNKLDAKADRDTRDTIVCIGDSYGNGTGTSNPQNNNFFKIVASALNLTITNMSIDGAGWLQDGGAVAEAPFTKQLDAANNRISDKRTVKYVMIAGGRNDVDYHSATDIRDAAVATVNKAGDYFPHSTIVVVPMMWDSAAIPEKAYERYVAVTNALKNIANVQVIRGAWTWLKGEREMIIADGIHPTNAGNVEIASYILAGLRGENTYAMKYSNNVSAPSAFKINQRDCRFENGVVSICVRVSKVDGTNWNANEAFAILPRFCNVTHSTEYFPCIYGDGTTGTVGVTNSSEDAYTLLKNFNAKNYQGEIMVNISYGAAV